MKRMRLAMLVMAGVLVFTLASIGPAVASPGKRVWILHYVPHTILCHRSQAGQDGLVYGDGPKGSPSNPFKVVCEPIHAPRLYGWDAESW